MDDQLLLERFTSDGSQDAFLELTVRYTNLVYGCAVQRLRDAHTAQDVTQAVFLALALKAKGLRPGTPLSGWLFKATRFACAMHQRGEQRRKEREMRAFEENQIAEAGTTTAAAWEELQPHLAGALDSLSGTDREAVLLRFYRKASHQEVAAALGTSEDGARKRVDRALDKLRRFFTKKGVALSTTALAGALTANAASAAPAGLAATASATALAGVSGTLATTSTLALAKGAIHMMFIAQVKTVAVVAAACVVVAGGGVIVAKETLAPRAPPPDQVCKMNARCLFNAYMNYTVDHRGQAPKNFEELFGYETNLPSLLICPAAHDKTNSSYELFSVTNLFFDMVSQCPLIREINANHNGRRVVCFADGHVEMLVDAPVLTNAVINPADSNRMTYFSGGVTCQWNDAVQFLGNATFRWNGMTVCADKIRSRAQTKEIWADGHVLVQYDARPDEMACSSLYCNYGTASTMRVEGVAKVRIHAPPPASILVRLVAAESPARLVSDLERIVSVKDPTNSLEDATLWVRSASVDATNTFERYYKNAFLRRTAELTIPGGELGAGEHVIEPGHHVFRVEKDGTLFSTDPDIVIDGQTVSLKTHRIEILQTDSGKSGLLGLYLPPSGFDAVKDTFDAARATNLLSHSRNFTALRIYLPANTIGNGYLLTPSMQAFHVRPGGTVEFKGTSASGLKAEGSRILLP